MIQHWNCNFSSFTVRPSSWEDVIWELHHVDAAEGLTCSKIFHEAKTPLFPQDLTAYYESPSEGPVLVYGDGDEEMLVLPRGSSYLAIVVFAAAFDPLSTIELADFSSAVGDFNALDCELVGLARDSSVAIKEWMLEVGKCQYYNLSKKLS